MREEGEGHDDDDDDEDVAHQSVGFFLTELFTQSCSHLEVRFNFFFNLPYLDFLIGCLTL